MLAERQTGQAGAGPMPFAPLITDYEIPRLSDFRGQEVILFGASVHAPNYLKWMTDEGIIVRHFSDNDAKKHGTFVEGVEVVSPDYLKQINWSGPIIVCSFYFNDILKQLTQLGFTEVHDIITQDPNLAGHYDPQPILDAQDEILRLHDVLADEVSKKVLMDMVQYRLSLGRKYMGMTNDQYFPEGVIKLAKDEVFIDCGSFTGEIAKQFAELAGPSLKQICCFEPDPRNFKALRKNIEEHGLADKTRLFNNAVFNENAELRFSSAEVASASELTSDGDICVQAVCIDDVIGTAAATFIKMDVEGAEVGALKGAAQTIKQHRPKMAICVYHKPADLWEIPLFIKSMVPEYKLYLRHHSGSVSETVCYAVVEE